MPVPNFRRVIYLFWICILCAGCRPDPTFPLEIKSTISDQAVKELDALQTRSGALVAALMERSALGTPEYICTIYRSEDAGMSWQKTFTLEDTSRFTRQYADPRLVEDEHTGALYLVAMQVRFPQPDRRQTYRRDYYLGDIVVFRSEDDGQQWTYQSTPHVDPIGAYGDLPFPLVDRQGCLWIFHSRLDVRKLIAPSEVVVHRSCDGGISWSPPYQLSDSRIAQSRKNLGNLVVKDEHTLLGAFTDQKHLYYFELNYQNGLQLQRVETIPHPFDALQIPIVYLHYEAAADRLDMLSYLPHQRNSPIWHAESGDSGAHWRSRKITDRGAYPNLIYTENEEVLITYNQQNRKSFQLMHSISRNGDRHFSRPAPLYQNPFRFSEGGEYQALIPGRNGQKLLIFCDWSDYSRAKYGLISRR